MTETTQTIEPSEATTGEPLLVIEDLHAGVDDRDILRGISLTIRRGEIHAIMGPNGSGKSTLAYLLMGRPGYEITRGSVKFKGEELLDSDERDLRQAQARQPELRRPDPAAHVEDLVPGARAQSLHEEVGEGIVPPLVADVLERGGSECIEGARRRVRSGHGRLIYHTPTGGPGGARWRRCAHS